MWEFSCLSYRAFKWRLSVTFKIIKRTRMDPTCDNQRQFIVFWFFIYYACTTTGLMFVWVTRGSPVQCRTQTICQMISKLEQMKFLFSSQHCKQIVAGLQTVIVCLDKTLQYQGCIDCPPYGKHVFCLQRLTLKVHTQRFTRPEVNWPTGSA